MNKYDIYHKIYNCHECGKTLLVQELLKFRVLQS